MSLIKNRKNKVITISEDTYRMLVMVKGMMEASTGEMHSFDRTISELCGLYMSMVSGSQGQGEGED